MKPKRRLAHIRVPTAGEVVGRARAGERGSVLVVVALCLTVIVTCTALTIDLGRVSTKRRDLQNVADAAAMDLVRLLDGRTAADTTSDPLWTSTLNASLERNDFVVGDERVVTVAVGWFNATTETFTVATGTDVPTAVRVIAEDHVEYAFAPGGKTTDRQAVASQQSYAGIMLGSYAARVDSDNSALLNGILGDALNVTAVGYTGLVGAEVGLDALATELGLGVGSPDELLDTELTLAQLITAQAEVLRQNGNLAQAAILDQVVLGLPNPDVPVTLGDIMSIAPGGEAAAAVASLDVLDMLTTTAFIANGSSFLSVPNVGLSLPGGIITQSTRVRIIEGPRIAFGGVGTHVETAQVRLETTLTISLPNAASPLSQTSLSLVAEAAQAEATIAGIGCGVPKTLDTDVSTSTATATASGDTNLWVNVPILGRIHLAEVATHATTGQSPSVGTVDFVLPPDEFNVPKQYNGSALDLGGATVVVDDINVLALSLGGLVNGLVGTLLSGVLNPVLDQLDSLLLRPLMDLLGVSAPGADVTPLGIGCSAPDLVH